jgi:hypothetical protein
VIAEVDAVTLIQAAFIGGALFVYLGLIATTEGRITETALEVRVLGKVVRRVPFTEVEEVHRRGALIHEPWAGPKFWNAVTVRRRRGLLRNLVLTPDDPDRFVQRLREAILRSRTPTPQ